MKSFHVLVLIVCVSTFAVAGDHEFHGVVHSIEHTYGVHHMRIPLLGVALFFARPAGVHGFKLAVFEGFQSPNNADDLRRVVESSLGPGWYPFVRVHSKGNPQGETTLIYTNPSDSGKMRMMIVSVESSEATIVQVELSDRAIEKWLKEPGEQADGHSSHRRHYDEN